VSRKYILLSHVGPRIRSFPPHVGPRISFFGFDVKQSFFSSFNQMLGEKIFTAKELAMYDGTNSELPIYLAIKGTGF
jgi:hypothetical protein